MEFRDQLQRKIVLKEVPKRIISLVPSQTELLVDLGLEQQLVGITKFCVHPQYLRKNKQVVGGTKQVHLDKISALNPDIILCNKEENTAEMVAELEKIAPVHVSDILTINDALELMQQYGEIFNTEKTVKKLINSIEEKISAFKTEVQSYSKLKVAYFIWKNPYMVAGKNTFIDTLLNLNKLENVYEESRYPETNFEDLQAKNPDIVMLSSEPFPFKKKNKEEFEKLGFKTELVDGEYFSWYGSRLENAIDYFREFRKSISD